MAKYLVEISVNAVRLPEEAPPARRGTDDALESMARAAEGLLAGGVPVFSAPRRLPSLNSSKTIQISAPSFAALAEIIAKFDTLADDVECNNPVQE